MKNTKRSSSISRRDAVALFATTPALGAGAALSGAFGGTALAGASVLASAGASRDLSQLSAEHFEALVGDMFTVGDMTVTLRDVRRGPDLHLRQQFAMIFDAPAGAPLASAIAPVAHPAIGQHDLFVGAVNDGDHRLLEICFS